MNPALKQLRASADLNQQLLIDKVLSLVADDVAEAEKKVVEVQEKEARMDFVSKKFFDFIVDNTQCFRFTTFAEMKESFHNEYNKQNK